MNKEIFAVDASLLQELGDRLIGRAPVALAELIKNAYDADAATCRIEFRDDQIIVSDDGSGMSERDFLQFWMRIGTTHKVDEHASPGGRPFTGSKGIGRLSVQFLAGEMMLESTSDPASGKSLLALVDWSTAVRGQNLDTVVVEWDMVPETPTYTGNSAIGTRVTLKKLKSQWSADELENLGREVWQLRSPFKRPPSGRAVRRPEDFAIDIDAPGVPNAREAFDAVQTALFANWKARIRGMVESGRGGGRASVTVEFKAGYPDGTAGDARFHETVALPVRKTRQDEKAFVDQTKFEILIFKTEGLQKGRIPVQEMRNYLATFGNVSVYDAGFRLPYYGSGRVATGQDWLSVAIDQGRRLAASSLLPQHLRSQNRYLLDLPAPGRIFGAVEINTNEEFAAAEKANARPGEWLVLNPGRDRLQENAAFTQLRDLVRFSLDLYAARHRLRALQAIEKGREREPASKKYGRVITALERVKAKIPASIYSDVRRDVIDARRAAVTEEEGLDRRAAILGPMATAGMFALALSHELAREHRFLQRVDEKLRELGNAHQIPELITIADDFQATRDRLVSLRQLFAPLVSEVDREATDRVSVVDVVSQAVNAMRRLMPGVTFQLSGIPATLHFPLGSFAEWSAVIQNVLANAWNAMLDSPKTRIMIRGGREARGREWLRISDTGVGLDIPIEESLQLFEPLERRLRISEDKRSIAIGGEGLGLAIVRMIASRRAATVGFVEPDDGFSTTLELAWKGAAK